jgi:hypothetical protein
MSELNGYELNDFNCPEKAEALIKFLGIEKETDTITDGNGNDYFLVNDPPLDNKHETSEYLVLTDIEADDHCETYLDDNRDMWVEAVKADRTDESWEDWKESVVQNDGRGSIISGYDGCENEEDVNGTTYYIYRTN